MLQQLITFSLRRPGLVLLLAALVLGAAIYQVPRMPLDVFPELNAPTVVVLTESPGLAADEVEQNVTFPIESAVNGLPGLRAVRSSSSIGLSLVWIEFAWGADIHQSRMLVSERLAAARQALPPGSHSEMTPITSITGEIMLLSLSSPDGSRTPMEVRAYAEFDLRNHLLAVPGVAQIAVIGGELPEYQVLVRQERLRLFDLTIDEVVTAARGAHSTAGAGYLPDTGGLELPVRQTARVRSTADIAGTVVRFRDGRAITIGDVAEVVLGPAPARGTAADGGRPAVVLGVQKAPGTNTRGLTQAVDSKVDQNAAALPTGPPRVDVAEAQGALTHAPTARPQALLASKHPRRRSLASAGRRESSSGPAGHTVTSTGPRAAGAVAGLATTTRGRACISTSSNWAREPGTSSLIR